MLNRMSFLEKVNSTHIFIADTFYSSLSFKYRSLSNKSIEKMFNKKSKISKLFKYRKFEVIELDILDGMLCLRGAFIMTQKHVKRIDWKRRREK